ncbi:MAG: MFS transporter [Acidobacteriaceae bacterium]|nr:MFS transporter [Acidobacteriaceae bacterium]
MATQVLETPAILARPNVKVRAISFGASLAFLSFLDRAAISQAAPHIIRDLHLSPAQMGLAFSAFGITYAAGEIPSGWLCDRIGTRRLLARVVILWSLFTALTGAAWNFWSLFVTRVAFGAGESGCFPGIACVFRGWLDPADCNNAEGIKAASARLGAAVTPALMTAMFAFLSWRATFAVFGIVGLLWTLVFWNSYEDPQPTPVRHDRIRWPNLLSSRTMWALGLQWFCHYYGFYFYITWLPLYLLRVRGFDLKGESLGTAAPLIAAALGSVLAGWLLARIAAKTLNLTRVRRIFGYIAYLGAAILIALFPIIAHPALAICILSLSSFLAEFSSPISWTTAMDIGGHHVGTVSGLMNTLGHLGGSIAPAVVGFLLSFGKGGWNTAFWLSAAIYGAGALLWRFIDSETKLELD